MNKEKTLDLMLDFGSNGRKILPVATQDYATGQILMVCSVNKTAFNKTLETGYATYWSRTRKEVWTKGLTSGDLLGVLEIWVNCEQNSLVYVVEMLGNGACHTKDDGGRTRKSCFYRRISGNKLEYA